MTTELHTLSGAYALNAVSPEEADEFHTHLDVCPACIQEVREFQQAAAQMGQIESLTPPAHLKPRVMSAASRQAQLPPRVRQAQAGEERHTPKWFPRLLAAAAAVVLIAGGAIGIGQMVQDQDESQLAASVTQVFEADDANTETLRTSNGDEVSVATSPSLGKMAVDTDELSGLKDNEVYQLWVTADGTTESAGILENPEKGATMDLPDEEVTVAMTIEPAGGSDQPTSNAIMSVVPSDV